MATAFRRASGRYVARFDPDELTVVVTLLEQTRDLLVGPDVATTGDQAQDQGDALEDEFEHLMRSAGWGQDGTPPPAPSVRAGSPAGDLPSDPALRRLLPDPNPADPQAAAEFRRLTGTGLRERKAATIAAAVEVLTAALSSHTAMRDGQLEPRHRGESGGRRRKRQSEVNVDLDQVQAQALMVALTDVRLVLGERLELNTEDDAEAVINRLEHSLDPEDPLVAMAFAYDFLTWLQESLTQALLGG